MVRSSFANKSLLGSVDPQEPCAYLALIIVDSRAQIQMSFWNALEGDEIKDLLCAEGTRLRPELEAAVCALANDRATLDSHVIFRDRDVRFACLPYLRSPELTRRASHSLWKRTVTTERSRERPVATT